MYRQTARTPTPPTRIAYVSKRVRIRGYPLALLFFAFGVALLASVFTTHLECPPTTTHPQTCVVTRYALFTPLRTVEVDVATVTGVKVDIRKGSKGGTYALAYLVTTHGESVNLASGIVSHLSPDSAYSARDAVGAWLTEPRRGVDVWLSPSAASNIMMALFGVAMAWLTFVVLREQLRQLFAIVIEVDHDRGVVRLGGREVRVDEIHSVDVQPGRALFWASGKNEHVPGFRIVIATKHGKTVPATPDYRAGGHIDHERARDQVLAAIGRANPR